MESIFDLCEAADWIEREIHEEYSIDFTGRDYEPLLLRKGDKSGVNLREDPNAQPKPAPAAPGEKEVAL
jgi:NADH:ubiquinone oxidoreductase subunit C